MRLDTNIYPPAELTGFARTELAQFHANENRDIFAQWLPNDFVRDIEYEIREGGDFEENVAMFRAYDAESPIGDVPGFSKAFGRIPPISEKTPIGEYDGIRAHQAGDLNNQIERRAERQARGIARRIALARAEAIIDGKITINENGFVFDIDFGRDVTHTATPSALWSLSSTADPVADLVAWAGRLASKGYRAGVIKMAPEVLAAALSADKVVNAIIGAAAQVTQVSVTAFNILLAQYGLPPAEVDMSTIGNTSVLGDDKLVMLPTPGVDSAIGATLWGETAEARLPEWGLNVGNGEGPGVVSGVYRTEDPVRSWVKTAAIAIPFVAAPNATLAATVL